MSAAVAERVQRRLEVVMGAAAAGGAHGGALSTRMTAVSVGCAAGWVVGGWISVAGGGTALAGGTAAGSESAGEGRAAGEDDVAMRIEGWFAIVSSRLACSAASSLSCASGAKGSEREKGSILRSWLTER